MFPVCIARICSLLDKPVYSGPAYYSNETVQERMKKLRAERRRQKLLDNAATEARVRRERENTEVDEQSDEKTPSPPPPYGSPWNKKPGSPASGGEINLGFAGEKRGESSSLMEEERRSASSPEDPTMMSIADIMRVKEMMKERKKRVRKILLG